MKNSLPAQRKTILTLACAAIFFSAQPASAQRATDVVCTGCVHNPDIANNAVNSAKVQDSSLTGADVANGSLTGADVANGSLNGGDVANGGLTGIDVANGTLTGADIANNSLTGADIANLTGADIVNNSLTGADVTNLTGADINYGSVPSTDISNEAGGDRSTGVRSTVIDSNPRILRSVTISAPSFGLVVVNASGYFRYSNIHSGGRGFARCSITTGTAIDTAHLISSQSSGEREHDAWGATRAFKQSKGSVTYRLVCDGSFRSGSISVAGAHMTAIFVPTIY